jgi:hypothetical protein
VVAISGGDDAIAGELVESRAEAGKLPLARVSKFCDVPLGRNRTALLTYFDEAIEKRRISAVFRSLPWPGSGRDDGFSRSGEALGPDHAKGAGPDEWASRRRSAPSAAS